MKISVIVPIYNKEKYLRKCIESIINQSYRNIEIILVNDGSTDNSLEICKSYQDDVRIKIISTENKGVSSARNIGLDLVSGEKVIFIDADDYIDTDFVENIFYDNYDLVISGYKIGTKSFVPKENIYFNSDFDNLLDINNSNFIVGPIGKLFDSKIIKENKMYFDEKLSFGEDTCYFFNYLCKCKDVKFINYAGYNNVIIDGTLSRKYVSNINDQLAHVYNSLKKITSNKFVLNQWNIRNIKVIVINQLKYCNNLDVTIENYIHSTDKLFYDRNLKNDIIIFLIKLKKYNIIKFLYIVFWRNK